MSYATSIDNLLSASPTGDYKSIFSTFALDGSAVYNTNLWGGGGATLDWTGIIWNDDGPTEGTYAGIANGVAITKRHVLCTNHGGHAIGINATWIKADGSTVTRNLEAGVTGIGGDDPDGFRVLYLDADLPAGIAIYPVLGGSTGVVGSPAVKLDQENKALIANVSSLGSSTFTMAQPTGTRDTYYEASIGGDSGSPVFMLSDTQLLYATGLVFGGAGSGPSVLDYRAGILNACASLDAEGDQTGYTPRFGISSPANHLSLSVGIGI